jgi:hypothetical protein
MREVFMIDRFDAGDRVVLKSFERGHPHDNDEIARMVGDDLEHWLQLWFPNLESDSSDESVPKLLPA